MGKCEICDKVCGVSYANTRYGMTALCMTHYIMAKNTQELRKIGAYGEKTKADYKRERLETEGKK